LAFFSSAITGLRRKVRYQVSAWDTGWRHLGAIDPTDAAAGAPRNFPGFVA
jgi:hypothetical protein